MGIITYRPSNSSYVGCGENQEIIKSLIGIISNYFNKIEDGFLKFIEDTF